MGWNRPPLSVPQALAWADAFHARSGRWPNKHSGPVHEDKNEDWANIDQALRVGLRTLPAGRSLARLLFEERGARYKGCPPLLTEDQILGWAVAHRRHTGAWPAGHSGPVVGAPGDAWGNIDMALKLGRRGLTGGSSLAQLLAARYGKRNHMRVPPLTVGRILRGADAHRKQTGKWPTLQSGSVAGAPGETWNGVDQALREGFRTLPGGSSLARLLAERRGRRNRLAPPALTVEQILAWAEDHRRRTGRRPTRASGKIWGTADENWEMINWALKVGRRGLPGGDSLARLLERHAVPRLAPC
jgi:hypothetical protein